MRDLTVVRLSENALCALLMSGVEAYAEKNMNLARPRNRLEIHGLLFGNETWLKEGTRILHVEMINVTTTSKQTCNSVSYSLNSIALKADITQSLFPQLSFLGDFHTHPCRHYTEVLKKKMFYFSPQDRKNLDDMQEIWRSLNYRVGLAVAISYIKKFREVAVIYADSEKNTLQIDIGNFRVWISAYIAEINDDMILEYSSDNCPNVLLHVPALTGLCQLSDFGIIKMKNTQLTYCPPMHTLFNVDDESCVTRQKPKRKNQK